MPPPTSRETILSNLRSLISSGKPIIGAGAGIGLTAKCIEAGGGDLVIIYNSGRYRMGGHGSLAGLMPYGNANDVVIEMAREISPLLTHTPLLAGICAADPTRPLSQLLDNLRTLSISGIQNFPTVGLIDGQFRANLEETGMGYDKEIDMIRLAHSMDFLTTPYVFDAEQARAMTEAGADVLVAHMGLTSGGKIGAKTGKSLEECVGLVQEIRDAAVAIREDVIVLCHGGPIAEPGDAEFVLGRTRGVHGFYGASSVERLPVEEAVTGVMRKFKGVKVREVQ